MGYAKVLRRHGSRWACLLAVLAAGCGPRAREPTAEELHIKHIYALANEYKAVNKRPPANADWLKAWALKQGKGSDADFISPRDNQPYVVEAVPPPINLFMVHEKTGVDGKLFAVNFGGGTA